MIFSPVSLTQFTLLSCNISVSIVLFSLVLSCREDNNVYYGRFAWRQWMLLIHTFIKSPYWHSENACFVLLLQLRLMWFNLLSIGLQGAVLCLSVSKRVFGYFFSRFFSFYWWNKSIKIFFASTMTSFHSKWLSHSLAHSMTMMTFFSAAPCSKFSSLWYYCYWIWNIRSYKCASDWVKMPCTQYTHMIWLLAVCVTNGQ